MATKTGFFFDKLTPLRVVHGAKLNDGHRSAPALSALSDRSANILMMATNRGEKWGIAKPHNHPPVERGADDVVCTATEILAAREAGAHFLFHPG